MKILGSHGSYPCASPVIAWSCFFVQQNETLCVNAKNNSIKKNCATLTDKTKMPNFLSVGRTKTDPWNSLQEIFHACAAVGESSVPYFFCTPESSIPFPIAKISGALSFLQASLRAQDSLLVGTQYQDKQENIYQALYFIDHSGVKNVFLKTHAIPGVEKKSGILQYFALSASIFGQENFSIDDAHPLERSINNGGATVIPLMCSEFFIAMNLWDLIKLHWKKEKIILSLHVNDSWFITSMRALLRQVAVIRSFFSGIPIVYAGFEDSFTQTNFLITTPVDPAKLRWIEA